MLYQKKAEKMDIRNNAMSLYLDMGLTRSKYLRLRQFHKDNNIKTDKLPPYSEIFIGKQDCYPKNIEIMENGVKIKLQDILDLTTIRILQSMNELDKNKISSSLIMKCKWGMDGSSGQQNFKLKCAYNDSSVFMVCFVPLELVCSETGIIVWHNDAPNSTRLCRPIEFQFVKETYEGTRDVYAFYQNEIDKLSVTSVENFFGITCDVKYIFQCTMIDGKTANALLEQKYTRSCNICRATPNFINDISRVCRLPCDESGFQFRLSTLHCWIRFMEVTLSVLVCLLS